MLHPRISLFLRRDTIDDTIGPFVMRFSTVENPKNRIGPRIRPDHVIKQFCPELLSGSFRHAQG